MLGSRSKGLKTAEVTHPVVVNDFSNHSNVAFIRARLEKDHCICEVVVSLLYQTSSIA